MLFIVSEIKVPNTESVIPDSIIRANIWKDSLPVKKLNFNSWEDVNKHLSENIYKIVIIKR